MSAVTHPKRCGLMILPGAEYVEGAAASGLRSEQKSYSLLSEFVFGLSQTYSLVASLNAKKRSEAVAISMMPHHLLSLGLEADTRCFTLPKETVLRQLLKCASHTDIRAKLIGESPKAAVVTALFLQRWRPLTQYSLLPAGCWFCTA